MSRLPYTVGMNDALMFQDPKTDRYILRRGFRTEKQAEDYIEALMGRYGDLVRDGYFYLDGPTDD